MGNRVAGRSAVAVASVIMLLLVGLATPALASSGSQLARLQWKIAGPTTFGLVSVSCAETASCVAAGSYYTQSTFADAAIPLSASLSGGSWQSTRLPLPVPSLEANATGVSCPQEGWCVGVGQSYNSNGQVVALTADTLSAGSWAAAALPVPADSVGEAVLSQVSCPAKGWCVAVGSYDNSAHVETPFAELLSGGVWSVAVLPVPVSGDADMSKISCPIVNSCVAVGQASTGQILAETLSPKGWKAETLPARPGWSVYPPAGISCPAKGVCVVVGSYQGSSGAIRALSESLSNGVWTAATFPDVGVGFPSLEGISCPAVGTCVAVGGGGGGGLVSESLSNGTWTASSLPVPGYGMGWGLAAVSCAAVGSCLAVGSTFLGSRYDPLAETLSGGVWTVTTPSLVGPPQTSTASISCTSQTGCVIVGSYVDVSTNSQLTDSHLMAETLSSGAWAPALLPAVAGSADPLISGVSCPTVGVCVATGDYLNLKKNVYQVEIDTLAGGTWTAAKVPAPNGSEDQTPPSCPAQSWCAVILDQSPPQAAILSNGTWTFTPLPIPTGADPQVFMSGLSCPAIGSCVAVGSANSSSGTQLVADSLLNGSWTVTTLPTPADAPGPSLSAIACPVVGSCVAVGRNADDISNAWQPITEALSSGTWTASTLPLPAGATNESLSGVSCASAGSCEAVGVYTDSNGNEQALADSLANSTWTSTILTDPTNLQQAVLAGVSCPTAASCQAVGNGFGWDAGIRPAVATLSIP